MNAKMIGASLATATLVIFPLAACGNSTPPAPVTTTSLKPLSPDFQKSYCGINSSTKTACEQHATAAQQQQYAAAHPTPKSSGLPWWAWALIVPAALVAVGVIGIKLAEANDERTIARANARVDELDARPRPIVDYDDYEDDDEDDELDEADMEFLRKATDPAPSASVQPAPPAGGGHLLSSLRNQGGAQ